MNEVEVFVEIDAPPAVVWDALLAFDTYPEWNPLTRRVEGVVVDGTAQRERDDLADSRELLDGQVLATVEPYKRLAWLDRFVLPFALDRYHEFHLQPIDDGQRTRLLQRETVRGALASLVFDETKVERAFVAMNKAVAVRAERRASATP